MQRFGVSYAFIKFIFVVLTPEALAFSRGRGGWWRGEGEGHVQQIELLRQTEWRRHGDVGGEMTLEGGIAKEMANKYGIWEGVLVIIA